MEGEGEADALMMVFVRSRKLKTGTFHYVVPSRYEKPEPCGSGREALEYAQDWAAEIRKTRRDARRGKAPPIECVWTLTDARHAHLEDARRRGLRTALPQRHAKASKLESHWANLFRFFGAAEPLDRITPSRIRAYISWRERTPAPASAGRGNRKRAPAGPGAINQDLLVLRGALELARGAAESGYAGDPFKGLRRLAARPGREPVALSEKQLDRVVRACWKRHQPLGAYVELLRETASRLHEEPKIDGDLLRYSPYKRGRARVFRLEGRLPALLKARRAFSRWLWKEVVAGLGMPDLNPHDIRHSVLTVLGKRPGMSLLALQNYGGWQSPAMAAKYLHPGDEALRPVGVQAFAQARATWNTRQKRS